jgi:hypothetical protein
MDAAKYQFILFNPWDKDLFARRKGGFQQGLGVDFVFHGKEKQNSGVLGPDWQGLDQGGGLDPFGMELFRGKRGKTGFYGVPQRLFA